MRVIFLSPGFPAEMPLFVRGLAEAGAHVIGIGDQAAEALDPSVREALEDYVRAPGFGDEAAVVRAVHDRVRGRSVDRVECLWEPAMLLAARLREALGVDGLTVEQTVPFRDKEVMKQVLDGAGVRTPRHARARTKEECREAAERIGFPIIVKPIAGAGAADTYPLRDAGELEEALERLGHVPEVSVEEFIEGEEHTFDTICAGGEILFENVAWYRPKPLVARLNAWMSPQAVCLRNLAMPELAPGRALGRRVLEALGFQTGFSHMEWFRTPSGEAVFGEIGARPPGGRLVHVMNVSCDGDLFRAWAEAVCRGAIGAELRKNWNAAVIFKRAQGEGPRIRAVEGLGPLLSRYGEHVSVLDLNPVGAPRRDWRQVIVGDGWIVVRHPDLPTLLSIADRFSADLRILAG